MLDRLRILLGKPKMLHHILGMIAYTHCQQVTGWLRTVRIVLPMHFLEFPQHDAHLSAVLVLRRPRLEQSVSMFHRPKPGSML